MVMGRVEYRILATSLGFLPVDIKETVLWILIPYFTKEDPTFDEDLFRERAK